MPLETILNFSFLHCFYQIMLIYYFFNCVVFLSVEKVLDDLKKFSLISCMINYITNLTIDYSMNRISYRKFTQILHYLKHVFKKNLINFDRMGMIQSFCIVYFVLFCVFRFDLFQFNFLFLHILFLYSFQTHRTKEFENVALLLDVLMFFEI
jgi:hypothetical protein